MPPGDLFQMDPVQLLPRRKSRRRYVRHCHSQPHREAKKKHISETLPDGPCPDLHDEQEMRRPASLMSSWTIRACDAPSLLPVRSQREVQHRTAGDPGARGEGDGGTLEDAMHSTASYMYDIAALTPTNHANQHARRLVSYTT